MTDYIDDKEFVDGKPIDREEMIDLFIPLADWIINQPILQLDQCIVSPEEIEKARLALWREIRSQISWRQRVKNFLIRLVS